MGSQLASASMELTIGELAELTACPIETVRYYERAGVIAGPPRSDGGRRVYGEEHVRRLLFIRRARELGFSLDRAKRLLRLADRPATSCNEAQDIARAHLGEVQQRLTELKRIENALSQMLDQCAAGATPDCAIIDPLRARAAPGDQLSG